METPLGRELVRQAPRPAEPVAGSGLSLAGHVHEKRGPTAARLPDALALGSHFTGLFTVLASHREGQRAQPRLADLLAALEAVAVEAFLQPAQRLVDLVERLGLHLDQGELDVLLDGGLAALAGVEHLVHLGLVGLGADTADLALHFAEDFTPTVLEDLLEVLVPATADRCCGFRRLLHDAPRSLPRSRTLCMMPPTPAKLLPEWQRLLELYCYDLRMMIGETRFQRGCPRAYRSRYARLPSPARSRHPRNILIMSTLRAARACRQSLERRWS